MIGVNAWTGAGLVSSDGTYSTPQGQFAAVRSTVLAQFLAAESLSVDQTPCVPPLDSAVAARLSAEDASISNEARLRADAEAKLAQQSNRDRDLLLYAGIVLVFLLTGGAILVVVLRPWRSEVPGAAQRVEASLPPPQPQAGVSRTAVVASIVVAIAATAGAAVAIMHFAGSAGNGQTSGPGPPGTGSSSDSSAAVSAAPGAGLTIAAQSPQSMSFANGTSVRCSLVSADGAPFKADMLTFKFDRSNDCVDGRTAYSTSSDGYVRYVVLGVEPLVVRNTLGSDLRSFMQEDYPLTDDQWAHWKMSVNGQRRCSSPIADETSFSSPGGALADVLSDLPPAPATVKHWSCSAQ